MGCCNTIDIYFAEKHARRDLARYLRSGPDTTTRHLRDLIRAEAPGNPDLLDIGAGIGVLQHELLGRGVRTVTHVDASIAYMQVAREECGRRGNDDRASFVQADYTTVGEGMPSADVVTLDRVLCCYPDVDALVRLSVSRCRNLYAISYPTTHWLSRFAFMLDNLKRTLRKQEFRAWVHPVDTVEPVVQAAGFRRIYLKKTLMWRIVGFRREPAGDRPPDVR